MVGTIEAVRDFCVNGKKALLLQAVKDALDAGLSAQDIMAKGLIPAMSIVGEKYSTGEFFLPQMMIAARAMQEAMATLNPLLALGSYETKAKVVIGTVAGDYHDIGKNIVKIMLESGGYEVVDLGVNVSPDAFVNAVKKEEPRFMLMSALITITMESMRQTIQALESAGVRKQVLIGIGGAPVTQEFANEIGADFYSTDAPGAVEGCSQLLQ